MELGFILAQLRKKSGKNQREFANAIGVSSGAVGMWERNRRQPDLEMLIKIAKYYNVSTDYLLGLSPNKNSTSSTSIVSWEEIRHFFPNAVILTDEQRDILNYYEQLSLTDKRWIMGQMIDLIKRAEENIPVRKLGEK